MASPPRIFSPAEANALLPKLTGVLTLQFHHMAMIESAVARMQDRFGHAPPDLRPDPQDPDELDAMKAELRGHVASFRDGWNEIEETGAVVSDLRSGVLDFYSKRRGQPVWLCWKFGEPSVRWWHPIGKEFTARRSLEVVAIPRTIQ